MVLISIKFRQLWSQISLKILIPLRSNIKHEKECFIRYPTTSLLGVWISDGTLFLVFDILLVALCQLSSCWQSCQFESCEKDRISSHPRWLASHCIEYVQHIAQHLSRNKNLRDFISFSIDLHLYPIDFSTSLSQVKRFGNGRKRK